MVDAHLRENLCLDEDYSVIGQPLWLALVAKFGGGPEISRPVILDDSSDQGIVEVYPLSLTVRVTD